MKPAADTLSPSPLTLLPSFLTRGAALPEDVRARLLAPLFDRPSSLLLGQGASTIFCGVEEFRFGGIWAAMALAANVLLALARIICLAHHKAGGGGASGARSYMAIGLLWTALSSAFGVSRIDPAADTVGTIVAMTLALGVAGGIASRNGGTPRYALILMSLWVLPEAAAVGACGGWFWMSAIMCTLFLLALCSVLQRNFTDMLSLIEAERANAGLAARLDAALSNMSQGLLLYDAEQRLQVANRRFYAMFGLPEESLPIGALARQVLERCVASGAIAHAACSSAESLETLAQGAAEPGLVELADGRAVAVRSQRLDDQSVVSTYDDITEQRRNEARIAHLARHDALTGLPNRTLFGERMEQALARGSAGEPFAVLFLDLDRFKAVNDTLGHGMGDRLLCAVASRIGGALRALDTVARLGGDEFAIILPGSGNADHVAQVASRLIDIVGQRYDIEGHAMVIGLSIGAALAPHDGCTAEALLMRADLALYAAKAEGRGRACFFEPSLSQRTEARHDIEQHLRDAVLRQEFELYYQPILTLETRQVVGCEALIRWNHPVRGLVMPDQFIGFAEESGIIVPLGEWVLCSACREAASWPRPLIVAVNVSPMQFRSGSLIQAVVRALHMSGLPPSRLEIEITEAAVLHENASTLGVLRELRKLGVRVALDDFGTGFSSLSSLHRFPFDKLKIDKSFVQESDRTPSATAILGAITSLGDSLGLVTTAEGVETEAQLARLRQFGCTQVQGYLFSRPAPAHMLQRQLADLASGAPVEALVAG